MDSRSGSGLWSARRRWAAWAAWAALVFGLWNSCAGHREARRTGDWLAAGDVRPSAATLLRALRALGTDGGDINRYLAYTNAVLGRPYQGYYVRPLEAWRVDARTLETHGDVNDPEVNPPEVPTRPLVPYRDFLVEYPPGFFLFAVPPVFFGGGLETYPVAFSAFMALLLSIALWAATRIAAALAPVSGEGSPSGAGHAASLVPWATGAALVLGTISVRRYDAVVSLSLVLLVLGCVTRRPLLAGVAIGVGVAAKGLPIALTPLPLLYYAFGRRYREAITLILSAAATGIAIGLPFARAAGEPILDALRFHAMRPLQVESTGGALLIVGRLAMPDAVTIAHTFGSANVIGPPLWNRVLGALSSLAPPLALVMGFAWTWALLRRSKSEAEAGTVLVRSVAASLALFMALGRVFSPQYLTWLLPLGMLASLLVGGSARFWFLAVMALTQIIYPLCYRLSLHDNLSPIFGVLVLLRNGALLWWARGLLVTSRADHHGAERHAAMDSEE